MADEQSRAVEDAAIAWHVRLRDANSATWLAFVVWLETDPAHSRAYDAVAALDREVGNALRATASASNENGPSLRTRRYWLAGAVGIAAAAAAALLITPARFGSQRYETVTAPGQRHTVDLHDGSSIAMNGATRLTLDHQNTRYAALGSGEATFTIRHQPGVPFTLEVGDRQIQDTGTVFNVVHDGTGVTVEVKEGSVVYKHTGTAVALQTGDALHDDTGSREIAIVRKDPEAIASWRSGRLDYDMERFDVIAADLSRNLGVRVIVDPALAQRQFSGTIIIDQDANEVFGRLGRLLGIVVSRDSGSWRMSSR